MSAYARIRRAKILRDMARAVEEARTEMQADARPVVDGQPCDTCPPENADQPITLESPARTVVPDEPISAAATSVHEAITWPAHHFDRWESPNFEPLTVHPDGRITGHLAGDGCLRNGDATMCVKYKRDPDPTLREFNAWTTTLDSGEVIRTGAITAGGPHAPVAAAAKQGWSTSDIRRFHEDTSTVFARVVAWEDRKGRLAVSGSMMPDLDPGFVRRTAGAPVSIEKMPLVETGWRNTLVGAHMVVTPAWPVVNR